MIINKQTKFVPKHSRKDLLYFSNLQKKTPKIHIRHDMIWNL